MPSHVPRRSRRPGSRRLHAGHRLASQRAPARLIPGQKVTPGSDATYSVTTRQQRFACARLPGPHLTSFHGRLLRIAHHDTVTGPAACGGLKPPPVRRLRRAITFISCAARHSTRASPTRASGLPPSWRTFFQELVLRPQLPASPPAAWRSRPIRRRPRTRSCAPYSRISRTTCSPSSSEYSVLVMNSPLTCHGKKLFPSPEDPAHSSSAVPPRPASRRGGRRG